MLRRCPALAERLRREHKALYRAGIAFGVIAGLCTVAAVIAPSLDASVPHLGPPFTSAPPFGDVGPVSSGPTFHLNDFEPRGQDMQIGRKYFGMHHTDVWFDMLVTNSSSTYHLTTYDMEQSAYGAPLTEGGLSVGVESSPVGQMVPDPDFEPFLSGSEKLIAGDNLQYTFQSVATTDTITFGPRSFSWKAADGNGIQLTGTLVAPGADWYLSWSSPPAGSPGRMLYGAVYYNVTGTYYGQPVRGYVYVENMWGDTNYDNTWWVQNRHGHWVFWTDRYADGTQEYGQFLCFDDAAHPRGALITNNLGQVELKTTNFDEFESQDSDGDISHIYYVFGDGTPTMEYTPDPDRQVTPGGGLGAGQVERIGETRPIVQSDAVELIDGSLCSPEPSLPNSSATAGQGANLKLVLGTPYVAGRHVRVSVSATGRLHNVFVAVTTRRAVLGTTRIATLTRARIITIRTPHALTAGRYSLEAAAPDTTTVMRRFTFEERPARHARSQ
jgi:hypothetical protein